jgi:hypothetical protein
VGQAFSHGYHPQRTERLAAYWAEALGGPAHYTEYIGDQSPVVRMPSGNGEHLEMDERAQACFAQALDDAVFVRLTRLARSRVRLIPDQRRRVYRLLCDVPNRVVDVRTVDFQRIGPATGRSIPRLFTCRHPRWLIPAKANSMTQRSLKPLSGWRVRRHVDRSWTNAGSEPQLLICVDAMSPDVSNAEAECRAARAARGRDDAHGVGEHQPCPLRRLRQPEFRSKGCKSWIVTKQSHFWIRE